MPASSAPGLALPAAARMQLDVDELDLDMTEYARLRRPTVRWWWGVRVRARKRGAVCYLCNRMIATWATSWPITLGAQALIYGHRSDHSPRRPFTLGTDTAGTSPAAAAPPPEGQ